MEDLFIYLCILKNAGYGTNKTNDVLKQES